MYKPYYIRENDVSLYLIPEDKIKSFDSQDRFIDTLRDDLDTWSEAVDKFNDEFSQYIVEGEISNMKLYKYEPEV